TVLGIVAAVEIKHRWRVGVIMDNTPSLNLTIAILTERTFIGISIIRTVYMNYIFATIAGCIIMLIAIFTQPNVIVVDGTASVDRVPAMVAHVIIPVKAGLTDIGAVGVHGHHVLDSM